MRELTFTIEEEPNIMPFGLIRKTRPFDEREPKIWEVVFPVTRFKIAELLDGREKLTLESLPIEKLLYSAMALLEAVETFKVFGL